jgi:hypothetical protein
VHYPASINRGDGTLLDCMIWDISAIGAKLTVATQDQIPDQFMLLLSKNGSGCRWCRVIWRSRLEIGVQFAAGPQARTTSTPTSGSTPDTIPLDC